jgi:hypothetical protein
MTKRTLKHRRSIDCKHPKWVSQKQHCKYGRNKSKKMKNKNEML